MVTTRGFDAATGRLVRVRAGASNSVQDHATTYNLLGNPLSRTDPNTDLSETFTCDALNRLTSATLSTSVAPAKTFGYDAIGNMVSKSDVGSYSYPTPGSPRPHAVTSISGGIVSTTYTYDANGNLIAPLSRRRGPHSGVPPVSRGPYVGYRSQGPRRPGAFTPRGVHP